MNKIIAFAFTSILSFNLSAQLTIDSSSSCDITGPWHEKPLETYAESALDKTQGKAAMHAFLSSSEFKNSELFETWKTHFWPKEKNDNVAKQQIVERALKRPRIGELRFVQETLLHYPATSLEVAIEETRQEESLKQRWEDQLIYGLMTEDLRQCASSTCRSARDALEQKREGRASLATLQFQALFDQQTLILEKNRGQIQETLKTAFTAAQDEGRHVTIELKIFLDGRWTDVVLLTGFGDHLHLFDPNLEEKIVFAHRHSRSYSSIEELVHQALNYISELKQDPRQVLSITANVGSSVIAVRHENASTDLSFNEVSKVTQSFLESPALPVTVDAKLAIHALGDHFASNSGLEGELFENTLKYLRSAVNARIDAVREYSMQDGRPDTTRVGHLETWQLLQKKLTLAAELRKSYQKGTKPFHKLFCQQIHNLDSGGDWLILPTGWVGHGIVLQVIKQTDALFTVRIFNTGDGLEYHAHVHKEGVDILSLPMVELADIEEKWLTSFVFARGMTELNDHQLGTHTPEAKDLYKHILPSLHGRARKHEIALSDFIPPQMSGTCAWLSIATALRFVVPDQQLVQRFLLDLQVKMMKDYLDRFDTEAFSGTDRFVAENALKAIPLHVLKAHSQGILNDAELEFMRSYVEARHIQLENLIITSEQKQRRDYTPWPSEDVSPISGHVEIPHIKEPIEGGPLSYQSPYQFLDTSSWEADPKTLLKDLKRWQHRLHMAISWQSCKSAQLALQEITQKIPLDRSFWNLVHKREGEEILKVLSALSQDYLLSFVWNDWGSAKREERLLPAEYLVQMKLLTLGHLAMHHCSDCEGIQLPGLYPKYFDSLLDYDSDIFRVKDPKMVDMWTKIRDYWQEHEPADFGDSHRVERTENPSFFGFEGFPAGASTLNGRHFYQNEREQLEHCSNDNECWDLSYQWQDMAWAQSWVQHENIQQRIQDNYPDLAELSLVDQAIFALSDSRVLGGAAQINTGRLEIFPEAFFSLRDLAFVTDFLLSGNPESSRARRYIGYSFNIHYSATQKEIVVAGTLSHQWRLQHNLWAFALNNISSFSEGAATPFIHDEVCEIRRDYHMSQSQDAIDDASLKGLFSDESPYRRRTDENQLILQDPLKDIHLNLPLDRFRQLARISSEPSLQVQETLGFFKSRTYLLSRLGYQQLFERLVLEGDLLSKEFDKRASDSAQLAIFAAELCQDGYKNAVHIGDISTAAYFLGLNHNFFERAKHCSENNPAKFPRDWESPFMDSRAAIHELLDGEMTLTNRERRLLNRELARTYAYGGELDADAVTELLQAVLYYRIYAPPTEEAPREVIVEMEDLLYRHNLSLRKHLTSVDRDHILNQVYHAFRPLEKDQDWGQLRDFPVCRSETTTIDVLKGTFEDGGGLTPLPLDLAHDPLFQKVFGSTKDTLAAYDAHNSLFNVHNNDGVHFRVWTGWTTVIQREHNGTWYQLLEENALNGTSIPQNFYRLHHVWIAQSETVGNEHRLLLTSKDTREVTHQGTRSSSSKIYLHRIDHAGSGEHLVSASSLAGYAPLHGFEDKEAMVAWATEYGLSEIHLDGHGLTFIAEADHDGEPGFRCLELGGYWLSKMQAVPALPPMSGSLILEKGKKTLDYLVLLPDAPPETREGTALAAIPNWQERGSGFHTYSYDLDSDTLIPHNDLARLHLARLLLWNRRHAEASKHLREYDGILGPLSEKARDLLYSIMTLPHLLSDSTPQAYGIRLQAAFQLLRDHTYHGSELASDFKTHLIDQYEGYCARLDYLDPEWLAITEARQPHWLTSEEEARILDDLDGKLSQGHRSLRHQALKGESPPTPDWINTPAIDFYMHPLDADEYIDATSAYSSGYTNNYLLTTNIWKNFLPLYKVARHEASVREIREALTNFLGITPPKGLGRERLLQEFEQAMEVFSNRDNYSNSFAFTLLQVVRDPERFMTYDRFRRYSQWYKEDRYNWVKDYITNDLVDPLWDHIGHDLNRPHQLGPHATSVYGSLLEKKERKHPGIVVNETACAESHEPSSWQSSTVLVKGLSKQASTESSFESNPLAELSKIFDLTTGQRMVDDSLQKLRTNIDHFAEKTSRATTHIHIDSLPELKKWYQALKTSHADVLSQKEKLEENLLADAHQQSPERQTAHRYMVMSGLENQLNIDDLIALWMQVDLEAYTAHNPSLARHQIDALRKQTGEYLLASTDATMKGYVLSLADTVITALEQGDAVDQALLSKLWNAAHAQRQYSIEQHREYLVFEYYMGILLRPAQVKNLDKLRIKDGKISQPRHFGAVLEMIMGAGKTAVLLPLLSMLEADGDHLVTVLMPEALLPSMSIELQSRVGQAFGQAVEVVDFERAKKPTAEELRILRKRLDHISASRRILMMTNSSVQSLFLGYIELMHEHFGSQVPHWVPVDQRLETEDDREDDREEEPSFFAWLWSASEENDLTLESAEDYLQHIAQKRLSLPLEAQERLLAYRDVMDCLRTSGWVTIDELDLILDVLKAHHFALGDRARLNEDIVQTVTALYLFLESDPEVAETILLPFVKNSHGVPYTEKSHESLLKPLLVNAVLGDKLTISEDFSQFLKSLNLYQKRLIKEYLSGGEDDSKGHQWVLKLENASIKNTLTLLHEEIHSLLPLTAGKKLFVHYGPIPKEAFLEQPHLHTERFLSIPYHAGQPVTGSRFGTELEILNYMLQQWLELGIPVDAVSTELDELKRLIESASALGDAAGRRRQEEALQRFRRMTNGNSLYNLINLKEEDREAITHIVRGLPDQQMELISKHVVPQIKTFEAQISTNAQIYASLFKRTQGFSGTVWNAQTYPNIFDEVFMSDTPERTMSILWQGSNHEVESINEQAQQDVDHLVKALYQGREKAHGSLIDAGGLFRGIPNAQVARAMLKQPIWKKTNYHGVVYYDEEEHLQVLTDPTGTPKPYVNGQGISSDNIIVYWDQSHTTGSDIPVDRKMHAVVTVSRHTLMRDLLQSVWRLRGLASGQSVHFVVGESDQAIISELLRSYGATTEDQLTLADILLYCQLFQTEKQGSHNHRALQHKLKSALIQKVVAVLIDPQTDTFDIGRLYIATRELFEHLTTQAPWERYGRPRKSSPTMKAIQRDMERIRKGLAYQAFLQLPVLKNRFSIDALSRELDHIAAMESPFLPDHIMEADGYQNELSVEVEMEVEVETEVEQEQEIEKLIYQLDPGLQALEAKNWDCDTLFDRTKHNKMSRSLQAILHGGDWSSDHLSKTIDPAISLSLNFAPKDVPWDQEAQKYKPFYLYQKPITQLLVTQNKLTHAVQVMVLDTHDAKQIEELLAKDAGDGWPSRKHKVGLYHLDTGLYRHGFESMNPEELEKSPRFQRIKTQLKFYRGDSDYSESEKLILRPWIEENDPAKMQRVYKDSIRWLEEKQRNYSGSTLEALFKELGVEK